MKAKSTLNILTFLCIGVSMSACSTTSRVYMPSTHHIPLLEDKGDFSISVNGVTAPSESPVIGYDVAAAMKFSDDMGVGIFSTYFKSEGANNGSNNKNKSYQSHTYTEFSVLYSPFEHENDSNSEFMLSIGLGQGEQQSYNCFLFGGCGFENQDFASGKYNKASLQYNYVESYKHLDSGFSLKMSLLNYYSFKDAENADSIPESGVFVEPAYFVRLGSEEFIVIFQTGITSALSEPDFNYGKIYASLGLQLRL